MRRTGRAAALAGLAGFAGVLTAPVAAAAAPPSGSSDRIRLPGPVVAKPLPGVGLTSDRLRTSRAPGAVTNDERVEIALGVDGQPLQVALVQRLELSGTGDYAIYERGPARAAEALDETTPPVAKLGTVVWQGFSPGHRALAARLTLDPGLEAPRLPLAVQLTFRDRRGHAAALQPGGRLPGPGAVTITLTNQTGEPRTVPTGTADAGALAAPLDRLLRAAEQATRQERPAPPPVAGRGLPAELAAPASGARTLDVVAPLRVRGTVRLTGPGGGAVTGPGTTPIAGGARIDGVLGGSVSFTAQAASGGVLTVDLTAVPVLDRRTLLPPDGAGWAAWAAAHPDDRARAAATDQLVAAAATAARVVAFEPYLGADLPGPTTTSYHLSLAAPELTPTAAVALRPHFGAITLAVVALALIVVNGALLWRLL